MADLPDLTSKALEIIKSANDYLTAREGFTTVPAELVGLRHWRAALNESARMVASIGPTETYGHRPFYYMLLEQLDLTQKHIQGLHETHDYSNVDLVFSLLHNQVSLLAGPQGPGKGNPIGPGRGRSITVKGTKSGSSGGKGT
jgi:hypothetical protein